VTEELLQVDKLVTSFKTEKGVIRAVDQVSFTIKKGQNVGLVGESGCGKSVTSLSLLRLVQCPPGKIESGKIIFDGQNLLDLSDSEMRKIRGNKISMIFQEPMTSLNPVFTIGNQIGEVFRIHQNCNKAEARKKSIEMLSLVKIPAPEERVDEYPHQLSGGMRQRVMIAMALACKPKLLIADEPTTALDVTIQAQILELMKQLQSELGMSILLITHDLGVVAEVCDYVMVMYCGKIIEHAPAQQIFEDAKHPYTKGLLRSIPKLGVKVDKLPTIEGHVPSPANLPVGCRFQDRCNKVHEKCRVEEPVLLKVAENHQTACWLHSEI